MTTIWINGTERLVNKTNWGSYTVYLDDSDIEWLNSIQLKETGKK